MFNVRFFKALSLLKGKEEELQAVLSGMAA
jgi:hypothetical protein